MSVRKLPPLGVLARIGLASSFAIALCLAGDDEAPPPSTAADPAAEEPAAEEPAPKSALDALTNALTEFAAESARIARVEVTRQSADAGFAGAGMITVGMGMDAGKPFTGEAEYWWSKGEEEVLVSKKELPGFEIFSTDTDSIQRVTFGDSPYDLGKLLGEISSILDPERLEKWLGKATLTLVEESPERTLLRGSVSPRLIEARGGGGGLAQMAMPPAKVLALEMEIEIGPGGRLRSIRADLLHNDPMMELARAQGTAFPGGMIEPKVDGSGAVEGGRVTYRCELAGAPSERATAFAVTARELLAAAAEEE